ncbi:hypothetical protein GTM63_001318 [Salmonella enterica]|nr:hypothetical protein [Salmonella enterica]
MAKLANPNYVKNISQHCIGCLPSGNAYYHESGANRFLNGVYAQVAGYFDHFSHVSVMRKVLLRMTSWMHYFCLDH